MKIAIIGSGWFGSHVAVKLLQDGHDVVVYERSEVFAGSSFYNQNRLHRGFHYSRNQKTRKLCYDTFDQFLNEYGALAEDIENNYYVIPTDQSLIDYGTFKTIFEHEKVPFTECTIDWLTNIEGSVIVNEKYINPVKAREYFSTLLKDRIVVHETKEKELVNLSKDFDYVINVTNNKIKTIRDCYYELSLTLVYDRIVNGSFGSITMVDGSLFSIYPYRENQYTVTDVEHTPVYTSDNIKDIEKYRDTILDQDKVDSIKRRIENKITHYYKDFSVDFNYSHYYTSIKVKKVSASADRYPIIKKKGNVISCVSGKIQGIYILENYIKNEIACR